jgi:hypothetical protein
LVTLKPPKIPHHLTKQIETLLNEGEVCLFIVQPDRRRFVLAANTGCMALIALCCALGLAIVAYLTSIVVPQWGGICWVLPFACFAFALFVALEYAAQPLLRYFRCDQFIYVLTNQRLLYRLPRLIFRDRLGSYSFAQILKLDHGHITDDIGNLSIVTAEDECFLEAIPNFREFYTVLAQKIRTAHDLKAP